MAKKLRKPGMGMVRRVATIRQDIRYLIKYLDHQEPLKQIAWLQEMKLLIGAAAFRILRSEMARIRVEGIIRRGKR